MLTEVRAAMRPAFILLVLLAAITGLAFPALITGIAQVAMPAQANGSLIRDDAGSGSGAGGVIGSELIAQGFKGARYFRPRPSAAGDGYNASSSAATNLAPGSQDLRDAIAQRVAASRAEGLTGVLVPPDLVTTSASGLDPHLSPEAAFSQIGRVAAARDVSPARLRRLIESAIEYPVLGIVGERRVNVLLLNRQLDRISANPVG